MNFYFTDETLVWNFLEVNIYYVDYSDVVVHFVYVVEEIQ